METFFVTPLHWISRFTTPTLRSTVVRLSNVTEPWVLLFRSDVYLCIHCSRIYFTSLSTVNYLLVTLPFSLLGLETLWRLEVFDPPSLLRLFSLVFLVFSHHSPSIQNFTFFITCWYVPSNSHSTPNFVYVT